MSKSTALLMVLTLCHCQACGVIGNNHEQRSKLSTESVGVNSHFYQRNEPSPAQILAGKRALQRWKQADSDERHRLADDLVVSKVLLGQNKEKLIENLGPPTMQAEQEIYWNAMGNDSCLDSTCELCVKLKNGQVSEVYLNVNQ